MKKLSTATTIAILMALLVATAALAMFTNGNFEVGDFSGWVKDIANKNGGIVVGPPPTYNNAAGPSIDDMFIVNTAWMNTNFGAGVTCDPNTNGNVCLPFAGSNSAVVNYLGKNGNLNKLTQQGLVAGGDVGPDGMFHIFFTYAPVLDKGSHSAADQPFMHVKLTRVRSGSPDKVVFDKFSYPDDGNPNWRWNTTTTSIAYMNWQVYDLTYAPADLGSGDSLTLEVVAAGCIVTAGGHWGYVYVDEFGPLAPALSTAPSISSLTPSSGPDAGGTSVTIIGENFTGATAVSIGTSTLLAGSFTVVDDTHITFTTPANSAGIVDISVINPGGSAVYPSGFTYFPAPAPTISSIVPNSGPVAGGTAVVITGTDFTGATTFTFGGTVATCTVDSATQITCTTPPHAAGPVDVVVTTPSGTATSTGGFTYIAATLTVAASGPATVFPGGQYNYTFAYTTTASVSNAQVVFTLPNHATYASNTGGYTCASASGVVNCSLGTIAANGSFDVTVAVDKLKKVNTPLTLATTAYSISASGVLAVDGTTTVTANTLNPFTDVPDSYWALDHIQSIWAYGVTWGCVIATPLTGYCPDKNITRGEMAAFMERAIHGGTFNPGTPAITFADTTSHFARYYIEALKADGITSGCDKGTGIIYCPDAGITRAEVSVFLLRGRSWPVAHVPPASTGKWLDVPATYWAVNWTDELGTTGISMGCEIPGYFCPERAVIRSEMAVLVQRTFYMTMPTP